MNVHVKIYMYTHIIRTYISGVNMYTVRTYILWHKYPEYYMEEVCICICTYIHEYSQANINFSSAGRGGRLVEVMLLCEKFATWRYGSYVDGTREEHIRISEPMHW